MVGASDQDLTHAIQMAKEDKTTSFSPQILSRAPEIDKPSIAFPSQVTEFCFPNKMRTIRARELKNVSDFETSFVVLTSADGNSIYVIALTFYEDLSYI